MRIFTAKIKLTYSKYRPRVGKFAHRLGAHRRRPSDCRDGEHRRHHVLRRPHAAMSAAASRVGHVIYKASGPCSLKIPRRRRRSGYATGSGDWYKTAGGGHSHVTCWVQRDCRLQQWGVGDPTAYQSVYLISSYLFLAPSLSLLLLGGGGAKNRFVGSADL